MDEAMGVCGSSCRSHLAVAPATGRVNGSGPAGDRCALRVLPCPSIRARQGRPTPTAPFTCASMMPILRARLWQRVRSPTEATREAPALFELWPHLQRGPDRTSDCANGSVVHRPPPLLPSTRAAARGRRPPRGGAVSVTVTVRSAHCNACGATYCAGYGRDDFETERMLTWSREHVCGGRLPLDVEVFTQPPLFD